MNKQQQSLTARVGTLESDMADVKAGIAILLERSAPAATALNSSAVVVQGTVVPKVLTSASKKGVEARSVEQGTFTWQGKHVGSGSKSLRSSNRKAFIKAHSWAKQHDSLKVLRAAVQGGAEVKAGWKVAI